MNRDELESWKLESLAKAIDWLSARVILKIEGDQAVFSGEDWCEFQRVVTETFNAKTSDFPPGR